MPQPTENSLHINAPLTNVSVAYTLDRAGLIADKVFPEIPVDHKTDIFWTVPRGAWFRDEAKPRAGGTESVGSGYDTDQDTYHTIVEAIHKDVDDQTRANADAPFNLDADATRFVTDRLLIRKEVKFLKSVFKTGVWGSDFQGVASAPNASQFIQWSDYDDSNPVKDIKRWKRQILATTGLVANTLVLGYDVLDALSEHPAFIDRVKYTSAESINLDIIARYFEVDRILVSQTVLNSGKEGRPDVFDFQLGKVAWLGYVAPTPGLLTPTAGYSFSWRGVSGGLGQTVGISKFRMDHLKADRVEGEIAVDPKIIAPELGIYAYDVVA
ncbi:major capsid protein [Microbacterium phage ValentiniPuff]|uniref:Major capsid protein n=1 Tax=Microbacterium phage ValentiniPuff TaxID=2315705 RepID=A0A386KRY5_9CAUD|nr:major capsid protein [Microbacterium phage ValentiniPuff]